MEEPTPLLPENAAHWQREVNRCLVEVAAIEALLLAGHPDVEGLCLALSDWSAELRILERMRTKAEPPPDRLHPAAAGG